MNDEARKVEVTEEMLEMAAANAAKRAAALEGVTVTEARIEKELRDDPTFQSLSLSEQFDVFKDVKKRIRDKRRKDEGLMSWYQILQIVGVAMLVMAGVVIAAKATSAIFSLGRDMNNLPAPSAL